MSSELVYTSVPSGLKPGSKGFCTVAMTAGLPAGWIDRLEPLSAYRPIYPLGDPKSDRNPINFSHWRVAVSGKTKSVLSRVAFAGADYSGRSNKLAHHIALEPAEQAAGGPAWMLLKSNVMRTAWTGAPQQFSAGPKLPRGDGTASVCTTWASIRSDAGWAGVLAESFVADSAKPAYLIYSPGTDILRLFDESLSLLSPAQRWAVTFSTFFTELPLNLTCAWRGVVAGTPAAAEAMRLGPRALVLDLTKPAGAPPSGVYADAARAGSGPVIIATAARVVGMSNKLATVTAPPIDPDDSGIAEVPLPKETAATATVRGRKRLAATGGLETEIPVGVLVEDGEDPQSPRYVVVERGVSRWVFTVSIIGCLLLGAAGSGATYLFLRTQFEHAKAATALAQEKIDEADRRVSDANSQRAAATQATATQTARADGLDANIKALDASNKTLAQELTDARKPASSKNDVQPTGKSASPPVASSNNPSAPGSTEPNWSPVKRLIVGRTSDRPSYVDSVGLVASQRSTVTLPSVPVGATHIAIAWPNGASSDSYTEQLLGKVELSAETRVEGSSVCLQVLATHAKDTAGLTSDTETPLVITLRGDKMTFDCSDAKVEAQVLKIIKLCVFEVGDNDSHTARFAFRQEDQSIGLSTQSYPLEIPSGVATELTSDPLDKWTSAGSGKDSIVYSSNANPKIQFRVWMSSTAGGSQSFQWDWPDNSKHYADAASLASKLQSECDQMNDYSKAGKDYPGDGSGYYDSALPPLFVEIKAQAGRLCTAKKTYDDRTGTKPSLEDIPDWKKEKGKFDDLIKELKGRCKIKQAFADQCRLDEFNVSLALPNGLELKKFHLKPLAR